jgi:hypothetical protein
MLLIGVPALGYLAGAGAWIVLRFIGVAVEHVANATADMNRAIALRVGYMLGRLFLLAITVIVVRKSGTKDDGLTALLVIVFAYTVYMALSAVTRPRKATPRSTPRST